MVAQPVRWPFGRALSLVVGLLALVGGAVAPSVSAAAVVDRDEYSTTVEAADGTLKTTISSRPLNFRDADGTWRKIDTRLAETRGGDLEPKAVDGELTIPDSLAQPIELEHDDREVTFRLIGADPDAAVDAGGSEATFAGALAGVAATYAATPFGVKETLTLASAASTRVFAYDLRAASTWTASMDADEV